MGQAWNGESCVGPPECPDRYAAKDSTCMPTTCPEHQVLAGDRSTCCWEDQAASDGACLGQPTCPTNHVALQDDCVPLATCDLPVVRTEDGLHCCLPGQTFDHACTGTPTSCPDGRMADTAGCARPMTWVSVTPGNVAWSSNGRTYRVKVTHPFRVTDTEVTQAQYRQEAGSPSRQLGRDHPVERVSWVDAIRFANALSLREGVQPAYQLEGSRVRWDRTSAGYRLPTEAEWLLLAPTTQCGELTGSTSPVDQGRAQNEVFGLCDNVSEWVWDRYTDLVVPKLRDPTGPRAGNQHVVRGGSFNNRTERQGQQPEHTSRTVGFRLVQGAHP